MLSPALLAADVVDDDGRQRGDVLAARGTHRDAWGDGTDRQGGVCTGLARANDDEGTDVRTDVITGEPQSDGEFSAAAAVSGRQAGRADRATMATSTTGR